MKALCFSATALLLSSAVAASAIAQPARPPPQDPQMQALGQMYQAAQAAELQALTRANAAEQEIASQYGIITYY
jgi:hypothetical protein